MIKARLTRTRSTNTDLSELRTNTVEGVFEHVPTLNERFVLIGESLTEGGLARIISTSPIKVLTVTATGYTFETRNSRYDLEILDG